MHKVINGDSLEVLKEIESNSVDSCVTDPPYELGFMGKRWDSTGIAYNVALWQEVYRVLKPGAHLLAFGGTRTYHRMACAIEDAGFEIRDQMQWLYGSGFPKSHDISKAIDKQAGAEREVIGAESLKNRSTKKVEDASNIFLPREWSITAPATPAAIQWQGWGTALKPANEPICVARKPFNCTVAENVLQWGTGAINVDAGRIETSENTDNWRRTSERVFCHTDTVYPRNYEANNLGRWPANVLLDETTDTACILDSKFLYLENIIRSYYGDSYMSKVRRGISDLSLQGERVEGEILLQDMLSCGHGKEVLWREPPNVRSKAFAEVTCKNERGEVQNDKAGEGITTIQGGIQQSGILACQLGLSVGETTGDCNSDGAEGAQVNPRAQAGNGDEIRQAASSIRNSASCKRDKERQPPRESGMHGQFDAQNAPQGNFGGTALSSQEIRGLIVYRSDLPDMFKPYFIDTGIEVVRFDSAAKMLDEQVPETSRFFYVAKASKSEREAGLEGFELGEPPASARSKPAEGRKNALGEPRANHHPTVKPIKLMEYLVKLVTPPNGIVLDPFTGSGTTGCACARLGFGFIGIEKESKYKDIAEARIKHFACELA